MDATKMWGIHTQNDSLFLEKQLIAIGWIEMGDLSLIDANREAYKDKYSQVFPDAKKMNIANGAGMLFRFVHEAQVGDYVIYPSKVNRQINIGIIESDYFFKADEPSFGYVQQRKVKWLKHVSRTHFSQGALYEVGSALTFFSIRNYADEFLSALDKSFKMVVVEEDETVAKTAEEIIESTKDFILKEISKHLKGYDFEEFVAELLRAMGYRTEISPKGGDSGIDLKAYKDELPPRIVVQVKSQDTPIGETMIQSLKGAMREGDYGLFITLSNYTKNAQKYLEHTPIIRGISGTELVDLTLRYYDKLSEKYRKMIPLKMVYIPVVEG
jgi:restriction system protein